MKGKRRCDCLSPLPGDSSPGKRKSNEREKEDVIVSLPCQGIHPPAKEKAMKGKKKM
ncbi:hypothetical protein [uncultured Parabacteroides sp.]|uniref:hypothetical protein n=1 Tax=uncultured Parabacteroides sp. TaxID=512312 RepID=UPI0025E7049C|nr:hypothetical protein [uncultured Parabacteroides sp.]